MFKRVKTINNLVMERMIQIPEWQFKHIENALRLTHRINKCASKETAFDREVVKAYGFATEALANTSTSENSLHKHSVSHCAIPKGWVALKGRYYTTKHGFTGEGHKQYHTNGKDFTYIARINDIYKG